MTPAPSWLWVFWVIAVVLGIIGFWILIRALFADRSRGRRRCPKCWYDMTGVPGLRCPECGREVRLERKLFKTRRRWRRAIAATLLLTLGCATGLVPRLWGGSWIGVMPTWALIASMWVSDTSDERLLSEVLNRGTDVRELSTTGKWMLARHCGVKTTESEFWVDPGSASWEARRDLGWSRYGSVLGALGPDAAPAVPLLIRRAHHSDSNVRGAAARMLGQLTLKPQPSVACLVELVNDPDRSVRMSAVEAIDRFAPLATDALPALDQAVRMPDPAMVQLAIHAIARMGDQGHTLLANYLSQDDVVARSSTLRELHAGRYRLSAVVAPLGSIVEHGARAQDRHVAASILGHMGKVASKAAPVLHRAITNDESGDVRFAALWAFVAVTDTPDNVFETLLRAMDDSSPEVRRCAVELLGRRGITAARAIPALERALNDEYPYVAIEAERTLRLIRGNAPEAQREHTPATSPDGSGP